MWYIVSFIIFGVPVMWLIITKYSYFQVFSKLVLLQGKNQFMKKKLGISIINFIPVSQALFWFWFRYSFLLNSFLKTSMFRNKNFEFPFSDKNLWPSQALHCFTLLYLLFIIIVDIYFPIFLKFLRIFHYFNLYYSVL